MFTLISAPEGVLCQMAPSPWGLPMYPGLAFMSNISAFFAAGKSSSLQARDEKEGKLEFVDSICCCCKRDM